MTEDVARRSIDWLYAHGCRVLALMGGEPLLRPQFAHKVVYYAAKKGFWIYIGTNGRLLRPDVADRLADAGAAVFNFAMDAWDEKPGLPKALRTMPTWRAKAGGGGGSRTPVRKALRPEAYMLSSIPGRPGPCGPAARSPAAVRMSKKRGRLVR